jgi:hypothetical protein
MKKILIVLLSLFFSFLAIDPAHATPTVTAGYGCTAVDNSTVAVDTAGVFRMGSTGMVVNILGYIPGTETTITVAVSYLDPSIHAITYITMGEDNATSGYVSAYTKTWRKHNKTIGMYIPVEETWTSVKLTFTLNGGSGGVFTCGVRTL